MTGSALVFGELIGDEVNGIIIRESRQRDERRNQKDYKTHDTSLQTFHETQKIAFFDGGAFATEDGSAVSSEPFLGFFERLIAFWTH